MRARTRMSILDSVQNFVQTYCDVNTHWKYINTIDTALKQGHNKFDSICC